MNNDHQTRDGDESLSCTRIKTSALSWHVDGLVQDCDTIVSDADTDLKQIAAWYIYEGIKMSIN